MTPLPPRGMLTLVGAWTASAAGSNLLSLLPAMCTWLRPRLPH